MFREFYNASRALGFQVPLNSYIDTKLGNQPYREVVEQFKAALAYSDKGGWRKRAVHEGTFVLL